MIATCFERLRARFGESTANLALGLFYAVVILTIVIFGATPETTLRYINL